MRKITCDVLVVGGGGGGLRAALAAKEENPDLKVVLATKGFLGKSGVTALACSDRMAFHAALPHTEPQEPESWRYHAKDIYEIGGKVSDGNLAEILAKNGAEAFAYLDKLNVPFVKKNGLADQFITDGSDYARACYTGPKTAVHIEEALVREIRTKDIQIIEQVMIAKLLTEDNRITGAIGIDTSQNSLDQALLAFAAKAVILAAGGAGKIYAHNVFPKGATGEAYALAYQAGAELVNMEFIQIGIASTKTKLNCSGSAMRALPRIVNDQGEEFLVNYFPAGTSLQEIYNYVFQKGASWPVTFEHQTHIIDIAVYKELSKGNQVYLDYSTNPRDFRFADLEAAWQERYRSEMTMDLGEEARQESPLNRLKEINSASIAWLKEHGVDVEAGEPVEIATCIQHFQGGVKIGEKADTKVTGLYAVGECAGGQHGANRPGGNALLDCQVFGKIAGIEAAKLCRRQAVEQAHLNSTDVENFIFELKKMDRQDGGVPTGVVRKELQQLMNRFASIVRTQAGLREALAEVGLLQQKQFVVDQNGFHFALETRNMLLIAEMILRAAAMREESRGPHLTFAGFEDNTPIGRKDPEWQKYIVISKKGNEMELGIEAPQPLSNEVAG